MLQKKESPVVFGSLTDGTFENLLQQFSGNKIILLFDEHTHVCCLDYLLTNFTNLSGAEIIVVPSGEESKSIEMCAQLWSTLASYQIGKNDLLINVGGGMITDLGGFVGATYKRGLSYVHIPTTILAMVDAAIGGKNGVNLDGLKNAVGTTVEPLTVFIDTVFLQTLPQEEWLCGFAEMLKHALISDRTLWNQLTNLYPSIDSIDLSMVQICADVKMQIVEEDLFEKGLRKNLNFGHTVGHAVESLFMEKGHPITHGHAVALGMLAEGFLSYRKGFLPCSDFEELQVQLCKYYSIPRWEEKDEDDLVQWMRNDKKNRANKMLCVLLTKIGSATFDNEIKDEEMLESLRYVQSLTT